MKRFLLFGFFIFRLTSDKNKWKTNQKQRENKEKTYYKKNFLCCNYKGWPTEM